MAWYNGLPEHGSDKYDLTGTDAVVFGSFKGPIPFGCLRPEQELDKIGNLFFVFLSLSQLR